MKSAWFALSLMLIALPVAADVKKTSGTRGGKPYFEATDQDTVTATVIAIDKSTRTVTMRTDGGDTVAVAAGPEVKNFAQIEVTDLVTAHITEQVTVEVATGPEMKDAVEVDATSAKPGELPQGTLTKRSRSTGAIIGIDKATGTVTLNGQDGGVYSVKAKNKKNLDLVKLGDFVVFTVTRSVAAKVEKAGAK